MFVHVCVRVRCVRALYDQMSRFASRLARAFPRAPRVLPRMHTGVFRFFSTGTPLQGRYPHTRSASGGNRQWRLRARPIGEVSESDLELVDEAVPTPGEGQLLVKNKYNNFR